MYTIFTYHGRHDIVYNHTQVARNHQLSLLVKRLVIIKVFILVHTIMPRWLIITYTTPHDTDMTAHVTHEPSAP